MSLPAPTATDFDDWRARYDTMTDEERKEWDARCYRHFPEQAHGSLRWIEDSLNLVTLAARAPRVVEVGGWRGDHAAELLRRRPGIASWTNIEFCDEAALSPKTRDGRFVISIPLAFRWWKEMPIPPADLLVLSHVVEHLSPDDLRGLLSAAVHIPWIYCEAPLPAGGTDWRGYLGTHILPWSWSHVDALFAELGYPGRCEYRDPEARLYERSA